ncbi:hypothetical protein ACXYMX_05810 [Sporosarcina sp. CAU 1771]
MKNDMRITYPLWMICFLLLIAASVYLVGSTIVIESEAENEISFLLDISSKMILFLTLLVLLVGSLTTFTIKVLKHNRLNPLRKFSFFYMKPPEYIDDDELFQHATGLATRKVYSFFVTAIPVLSVLYILTPIGKMWMVIGLLLLGVMQYLIYYLVLRKYVLIK